ncbi:MAG: peptidoglycan DD-metalloendopeptidase family protein [Aquificaceae bacterium]
MKEYVSIIVAYHEGKPPKTLRIKKSYLKALAFSAVSFIFVSIASYTLNMTLLSEKRKLKAEAERLRVEKHETLTEKERLKHERIVISKKLKAVEGKMAMVEDYLAKRGVIRKSLAVGGTSYKFDYQDLSHLDFLKDHSDYLLSKVKATPLGYPIYGRITSHMGWRRDPFGRGYEFHTGIDIEAPYGSRVMATADGMVELAGHYGDYGKAVMVRHPSGYYTLYGHLSNISVEVGQSVKAGDVVGHVGSTGRSTGPHLHYEVLFEGRLKNPIDYLVWR